jgi:hypothetical protein
VAFILQVTSTFSAVLFVAIMLDAGVDLGGIQIAACHADACTTMRHDRVG